jgi:hypothetical protein
MPADPEKVRLWVKIGSDQLAVKTALLTAAQAVDATPALNLSAGGSNAKVLRGRSFS